MSASTRIVARTATRNLLPPRVLPRIPTLAASSGIAIRNLSASPPSPDQPCLHVYDRLYQRLSNPQELLFYYFHKTAAQHKRNGNFVDIHDGTPADSDVTITDIGQKLLSHDISEIFGVPYLSRAGDLDSKCVVQRAKGLIWGRKRRCFLTLATRLEGQARWVHFLWDTGSPKTYLSKQAADALGIIDPEVETLAYIGGHPISVMVSPENSDFTEVNIIGMDYIDLNNVAAFLNTDKRTFMFYFGLAGKIEVVSITVRDAGKIQ